jgi:hypothetical protein
MNEPAKRLKAGRSSGGTPLRVQKLTTDPDFRSLKEKVAALSKQVTKLESKASKAETFIIQRQWTVKVLAAVWTVLVAGISAAITLWVKR